MISIACPPSGKRAERIQENAAPVAGVEFETNQVPTRFVYYFDVEVENSVGDQYLSIYLCILHLRICL